MKKITKYTTPFLILGLIVVVSSCASTYGKKVKEPFQGSKYESNARFFRGVGKGQSSKDNIAKGKADLAAKSELAGQVRTTMKSVADQYLEQTENENAADVGDKFQSLVRQVMNTDIADLRKIGEEKFLNENKYTVFIAYEIKKKAMLRFMKKQAKVDAKISAAERATIEKIIDQELAKVED